MTVSSQVAAKYRVDYDLGQVESLLREAGPSVLRGDLHYDTSLERRVLEEGKRKLEEEQEQQEARSRRIEQWEREQQEEEVRKRKQEEEKAVEDERQRLEEIEKEKKAREVEEERLEEERKKKEEEVKVKRKAEEEAEWSRFEEERWGSSKSEEREVSLKQVSSSGDEAEEGLQYRTPPQELGSPAPVTTAPPAPALTPPAPAPTPPAPPGEIRVVGHQSSSQPGLGEKINFSDFEALSDPFADLELKTMDDLAELRTILSNNHSTVSPAAGQGAPYPSYYPPTTAYQYPSYPAPSTTTFPPTYTQYTSPTSYSTTTTSYPTTTTAYPSTTTSYPNTTSYPMTTHPVVYTTSVPTSHFPYPQYTQQYSAPAPAPAPRSKSTDRRTEPLRDKEVEQESRKEHQEGGRSRRLSQDPDKTVGTMISDLQREATALAQAKSSRPNSRPSSRGATSGLENWNPWPRLEGEQEEAPASTPDDSCLADLMDDEATSCRQLHEMGFPLPR